ncbi:hypothetical protein B296_00049883 [Ensete ventricosum]|uniref:Uncharacterized protein n=1 Tax=Ensete ventricosum TaxID=4639 RepID=A0A426Y6Q2_ENSVE|nr:hypothetical protein B296_00049883 [Ensete ventricosum]
MQSASSVDPLYDTAVVSEPRALPGCLPGGRFLVDPTYHPVTETVCNRVDNGKRCLRATHIAHRVRRPTDASCCRNGASDGRGDGGSSKRSSNLNRWIAGLL